MKPRTCPECSGLVFAGERCPCKGREFRVPIYVPPGSANAAHFRALIESVRSGSWADSGYRAPHNPEREHICRLYEEFGGAFRTYRAGPKHSLLHIKWFLFRCEVAAKYWRNEYYRLMAARLILWLSGCDQHKTCDYLQISRDALLWLDKKIREYVWFPARSRGQDPAYFGLHRRLKAGTALDIIRRWQKGYKQAQMLTVQQLNPFD